MDFVSTVEAFIIDNFLFGESDHLKEDTSFLENGIIDSTGILELIAFLEETYDIEFEDDEVIPENLDSLKNIARFMEKKINGLSQGPEKTR
jgi:acyl carrier protein